MAKDKRSFILYSDLIAVIEKLVIKDREDKTNNAGELFLHILKYVNDLNPIPINFIVDMAFEPIKLTLKRDLQKYSSYIEKQRVNGAKGGRPKKTQKTQPFLEKPKKADSVSVSDSVNVINIKTHDQKIDWFKQQTKETEIYKTGKYPDKMFIHFTEYWTAKKPNGKKMAYEMEKTFSFQARLRTWINNDKEYRKI